MTESHDLPRQMAIFALTSLSEPLRADVLADGTLARQFDLHLTQPIKLDDLVLRRDQLFQAFRDAADSGQVQLIAGDSGGPAQAKVSIAADGAGNVEIGQKRWRFEYAVHLSSQRKTRLTALDRCLAAHTLSAHAREDLRQLAGKADFTSDDFIELARIFDSSPESFTRELRERVAAGGRIGKKDLLPDDLRHWEHLAPPVEHSATLDEYIANELDADRRARLAAGEPKAFASIALTCAAPALVPRELFSSISLESAVAFLEAACAFDDPFGLVAAFQMCADRAGEDVQFIALGERLLDQLFSSMDRLTTSCQLFGAAFIIATAHLSEHEALRCRPAFWRRLAAASHASLVVRACGVPEKKLDELVAWAVRVSGEMYVLSVLSDFPDQPRWRPEWIEDNYLVADLYGRACSVLRGIPNNKVPASWQARLDDVKASADKTPMEIFSTYPAVLEGERPLAVPKRPSSRPIGDLVKSFKKEPSPDHLLLLSPVIYTFGFPPQLRDNVIAVVGQLRRGQLTLDDRRMQQVMTVAAHIATETRDVELARAIADACIAKIAIAKERHAVFEATSRLVESAAVHTDRFAAASELADRLERLAFVVPTAEMCHDLAELLGQLKIVQPHSVPLLGRALAVANLGKNLSAAT